MTMVKGFEDEAVMSAKNIKLSLQARQSYSEIDSPFEFLDNSPVSRDNTKSASSSRSLSADVGGCSVAKLEIN